MYKYEFNAVTDALVDYISLYQLHSYLNIQNVCKNIPPIALLKLLQEASKLSSLSIDLDCLTRIFSNNELCYHLNKIIEKLDICEFLTYPNYNSSYGKSG
ncbi:hypothetical protein I4U23_026921 [Adineta vaga]|nr:hypothetical protein I4U23_026921 [Adineta vaga]